VPCKTLKPFATFEIETIVIEAVRKRLKEKTSIADREPIERTVGRVKVHAAQIVIKLARKGVQTNSQKADKAVLYTPWKKTRMKRRRRSA